MLYNFCRDFSLVFSKICQARRPKPKPQDGLFNGLTNLTDFDPTVIGNQSSIVELLDFPSILRHGYERQNFSNLCLLQIDI